MHVVTAIAAVTLTCKDLDASLRFYRALGFELREAKHGPAAAARLHTCGLGGVQFALAPDDGVDRGPQSGNQLGLMVSNLDGALAAVRAAGGRVTSEPTPKPWGITATVEDPDGRKLELVATRAEVTGPMPF
jgi:catechol 2,3-dioxygenase-like lactoylglutathione lyase family enzyme